MMKLTNIKFTRKEVQSNYWCYSVDYGKLQHSLSYTKSAGYTSGVYGWNADIYLFDDLAIVTGYRPFGEHINPKLVKKYEEKARKIVDNYDLTYEQKKKKVNRLLEKFIEEVKIEQ